MKIILLLVILFLLWVIIGNLRQKKGNTFDIYFGVPGSGKTTFAAYLTKKAIKNKKKVLSNVPIKGSYQVVKQDVGHYEIKNCLLILDEAGIDYNNRKFKSFSDEEVYFFKYHRHYGVDVAIFSQGYNDMDLKLRTLATRYYIVKKSILPGFVKKRAIHKKIGIDKLTQQIIDKYEFTLLSTKYIYCPKLWKMFDSYSYKELPKKDFKPY